MKNTFIFWLFLTANLGFVITSPGQTGWQWYIGSSRSDSLTNCTCSYGQPAVITDRSGNVFISGVNNQSGDISFGGLSISNPGYSQQLIVVKADSGGNYLWAISSRVTTANPISMATDAWGNLYLAAQFKGNGSIGGVAVNTYGSDGILMKFDPYGNNIWYQPMTDLEGILITNLGVDAIGNVYISGNFSYPFLKMGPDTLLNHSYRSDVFLAKYDSNGFFKWVTGFGGLGDDYTTKFDPGLQKNMVVAPNGNCIIYANFQSDTLYIGDDTLFNNYGIDPNTGEKTVLGLLACYDSGAHLLWAKPYSSKMNVNGMAVDDSGNFYMTGDEIGVLVIGPDTIGITDSDNFFLTKADNSGNILWVKQNSGQMGSSGTGIAVDYCGNVWVSGIMWSALNFDGNVISYPSGTFRPPAFVVGYNNSGNYLNGFGLGEMAINNFGNYGGIATDNRGNIIVGGDFVSYIQFGSHFLNATGLVTLFLAKFNYDSVVCGPLPVSKLDLHAPTVEIFPNPATRDFTLQSDILFGSNSKVDIVDMTGRFILRFPISGRNPQVPISGLSPGIYLCKINDGDQNMIIRKLVVIR